MKQLEFCWCDDIEDTKYSYIRDFALQGTKFIFKCKCGTYWKSVVTDFDVGMRWPRSLPVVAWLQRETQPYYPLRDL